MQLRKRFLLLFILFVGTQNVLRAQPLTLQNDYVFSTGIGTSSDWLSPTQNNNVSGAAYLGFGFIFEGNIYTHLSTNNYGVLCLGNQLTTGNYPTPFSNNYIQYNNPKIVAVAGSQIYINSFTYGVSGMAPNRIGVFTFNGYSSVTGYPTCRFSFQVQLYERTGEIRMVYGSSASANLHIGFQIGIASSATDVAVVDQRNNTVSYGATANADDTWPGQYRYYSFVPKNIQGCYPPYNLSVRQLGSNSVSLKWDVVSAGNGGGQPRYIVEYGPRGFLPGNGTQIATSNQPCIINGLTQDVTYDFYVRTVCDTFDTSAYSQGTEYIICSHNTNACFDFTALNSAGVTCTFGRFYQPYACIGIIDNGQNEYGTTVGNPGSLHTVHTHAGETDPYSGGQLLKIPPGECKSVRLGCYGSAMAQSVSYDINVDTNNLDLILLKYACVCYNAGHTSDIQPYFKLEILDANNNLINPTCGYANFTATDAADPNSGWNRYNVYIYWKDWTSVGLNVAAYHGQTIKVRLTSSHCNAGAFNHFCYAYYTLSCAKAKIHSSSCVVGTPTTLSAPDGFNYRWYSSTNPTTPISTNRQVNVMLDSNSYYCDVSYVDNPNCGFRVYLNHNSIGDTIYNTIRQNICPGDSLIINGDTLTTAGFYSWAQKTAGGCDSVFSIQLIIDTIRDTIHPEICAGNSFSINGVSYNQQGVYAQRLPSPDRCVYNLVIDLTVKDTIRDTIHPVICAGASFDTNGVSYHQQGVYTQHLRTQDSCFYNLVIDLTVNDTLRDTIHPIICAGGSYRFLGVSYYHQGVYTYQFRTPPDSCIHNLVIDLTVNDTLRDTIHPVICAGASFDTNGVSYHRQGLYTQHLRTPDSCFHNLVIDLTVKDTIRDTIRPVICA